ncbi:MAG: neutral zinc metallopeptidase [Acidimicrobiia bacterium]|nr:neutral zinc metallopeptidase [Acidimicrobiia bacterium]
MKWRRGYKSEHTEDRRRRPGAGAAAVGGGGILAVIAALVFGGGLFGSGGFDLDSTLEQFGSGGASAPQAQQNQLDDAPDPDAELASFSQFVFDDAQTTWDELFGAAGIDYPEARLVLFTGSTQSGCGGATAQIGPHYCPTDQTVYLDLDFFRDLSSRFGASGDFAAAYVIGHEVAHHVQNVTQVMDEVRRLQQANPADRNPLSVRLELQADCLAGVWARSTFERDLLEQGDLEEAFTAAEAVGDDRIQQQATGMINEESWTHGSSAERVQWFEEGFQTGDPNRCDTFG